MSYNAISLIGDMILAPLASAGAPVTYLMDPLNAIALTYNPGTVEKKERLGKGRTTQGTVKNVLTRISEGASLEIENDEFSAEILAIQTRGVASAVSAVGGAVTNDPITVKLDKWVKLAKTHLTSAAVTATADPGPTPAYTEDTHFVMNRRMGFVKFLSGVSGAPSDGASVLMSYTEAAWSKSRVAMGTLLPGRFAIFYDCINQASGKNGQLYVPQGVITPSDSLVLVTDAFVSGKFTVTPELLTGESAALYYDEDE